MRDFRKIKAWEKAHELALAIYAATVSFPKDELYGLTSQMRRSASSIPTNIAEGCGRDSEADFARFLQIAIGSTTELEYQILLSRDLKLIDSKTHDKLANDAIEIRRMLFSFIKTLKSNH